MNTIHTEYDTIQKGLEKGWTQPNGFGMFVAMKNSQAAIRAAKRIASDYGFADGATSPDDLARDEQELANIIDEEIRKEKKSGHRKKADQVTIVYRDDMTPQKMREIIDRARSERKAKK